LVLAAALATASLPVGAALPPSWPQFRHDLSHSGSNPDATPVTPANVAALQEA
jgi:hypothetical protein